MPTERKNKSTSTSPNINDSKITLNIKQRVFPSSSTSSTNYPLGISFLSSSSALNESEDMAYIEKRTAHNALERQRREGLNSKFQELAHVLPALQQIRRPSKSMIVAKSLEFVSSAVERQTDFEDQLDALRVENAQLLRQAEISTKRIKKQVETDHGTTNKNGKQPLIVANPTSIIKLKRLPSKMKPQLRQSSLPIINKPSSSSSPKIIKDRVSTSEVIDNRHQMKRSIEEVDNESIGSNNSNKNLSPTISIINNNTNERLEPLPMETTNNNKRRRNYTTELASSNSSNSSGSNITCNLFKTHNHHNRYNSHQPSLSTPIIIDDQIIISPVQSRQNSITALADQLPLIYDTNDNETLIVPTQFDMTTTSRSPYGTEHTYYNTYENFEHVSSIPALRTPIGRNTSTDVNILSQPPPPYDQNTSLDILNSIMQDHSPNNNQYYWHQ